MPSPRISLFTETLTPFLYPILWKEACLTTTQRRCRAPRRPQAQPALSHYRNVTTVSASPSSDLVIDEDSRLNPSPDSYSLTPFADKCTLSLNAGAGGHGCVSFLREWGIEDGPPNGGDGGTGGNVYIQAVRGETSLHKIARRRNIAAGRGRNGQGKGKGGERGSDVLVTVPVGTVVREVWRFDPVEEDERKIRLESSESSLHDGQAVGNWKRDRWILYPGISSSTKATMALPELPAPRRSHIAATAPYAPLRLDLDKPMEHPMLLAAGSLGGLGNSHFESKELPRPKMATRGGEGMKITVQLELKLLADVVLVGLPNAGKSTLLRALSNSRARVGNWAFTTLQPNIGTVVLDNHKGRPKLQMPDLDGDSRTSYTIADIPGLIEDAHLDKGLGLDFLRHTERASILAFVVDLSAGDAVTALKGLWKEVSQFEGRRDFEISEETTRRISWTPSAMRKTPLITDPSDMPLDLEPLPSLKFPPISAKPWFVIATKADMAETQHNFASLKAYLEMVQSEALPHPSNRPNAWRRRIYSIPISAINAQGTSRISEIVVDLLRNEEGL